MTSEDVTLLHSSMSSNQYGEGMIRRNLIKGDLMDCIVALPNQLSYSTQNSVRNWINNSSTSIIHSEKLKK